MPASPSLLIVPARFKTGKLYTQIATTSAGVVLASSGDFNVTRATTATRFNSAGNIESVASGVPRLDYFTSGGTAGCPALLVEPSAQNLAWHSQTWASGTNWTLDRVTTTTGTTGTLDPFGTNLANAISPTAVTGTHLVSTNPSPNQINYVSGTIYAQSAFFKQGTGDAGRYVQLTFAGNRFTQLGYANFDLQLGALAVVSGTSADTNRAASIENYGNGWYRCRLTSTCNASGTGIGFTSFLITASGDARGTGFTGVTGDVLYGFGAQLETGSIATSYIPTTTAAVTRNADVISVSGAVSGCIGQTEGTLYAEVDVRNLGVETYFIRIDDGASTNVVSLRKLNTNNVRSAITAPTFSGTLNISSATFTAGILKIAFAYKSGEIALCVNGANLTANGTFTFNASFNRISIGSNVTAGAELNDRIRSLAIYTTRLTNAELQSLTTL